MILIWYHFKCIKIVNILTLNGSPGEFALPPGVQKIGIRGIQDTRHMVTGKTDQVQNNGKNQSGRKSSSLAIRQLRIGMKAIRQKFNLGSLHKPK